MAREGSVWAVAALDDVIFLLERLRTADPTRPRLTWYGPGGERVELSGKVLDNWVAKTANLLVDELDVTPGDAVVVALPGHWRAVVWWLAAWAVGAEPVVDGDADVVVTDSAARAAASAPSVRLALLALPALAVTWDGDVPPGALDATTATRLQPDAFVPVVRPAGTDAVTRARSRAAERGYDGTSRVLVDATSGDELDWLAPLVAGGSVVLHHAPATLPPDAQTSLRNTELLTHPPHPNPHPTPHP